ncbi:ABC transporter G family member 7 isoform X2 [Tanacetum coccineum]
MFYQNRPFLPPYNNQNAFYQSPTGLYRPTMDSSTSSQENQPYSSLNRSAHGSAPVDNEDDNDSPVEEMSPVKKPSKQEIALCQAWCDVSENSEKGNSIKVKGFWEAFINYFKKESGSTRGYDSIFSKWKNRVRPRIGCFCAIINNIQENHESGSNDLDVYHKACVEYKMIYMHDFTFGHCYNILKDHQGWLEIEMPNFYKNIKGQKKSKTSKTTYGSAFGGFNLNDEAKEYEEAREHRPLGHDAAKAKKKSSASSHEGSSLFVDLVAEKYLGIKSKK